MTVALVLAALLAVACVVGVALPFLREPEPSSDLVDQLSRRQRETLELAETRDRAVEALRELESDHRGGRVSDLDYRALVGPLRAEVAAALRALDSADDGGSSDADANIA